MAASRPKKKRTRGAGGLVSPGAELGAHDALAGGPATGASGPAAVASLRADPSLLDAPPLDASRRAALAALAVWTLVQVAIPLRYYLGSDLYDERFAWRMFSAVRVQECDIAVTETRGGHEVALAPMSVLPAPWVGLLERSRPAVVRGFLDWRCETGGASDAGAPEAVAVRSACIDASGDPLPSVVRELSCEDRRYEERALDETTEATP